MAVCQELGYTILVDDKGGHRLDRHSLQKIKNDVFPKSILRIDEYTNVTRIPDTRFYTIGGCLGKGIADSDGVILVPAEIDEIQMLTVMRFMH